MIIGFNGRSRSGKDTAAAVLVNRYGFRRLAFADRLKLAARHIFTLSDDQLWGAKKDDPDPFWGMTPGQILQRLGTECLRHGFADDIWIKALFREVEPGENYVITDVRFPNEASEIERWGGRVFRIERPGLVSLRPDHISERALDDWNFAGVLVNGGTVEELAEKVRALVVPQETKSEGEAA
jgi:hypothetical protein